MATMTVSKHIAAPAEAVWAVLADFASVGWIPGAGDVQIEGEGPGMRRIIHGSGTIPVTETLIWVKPEQQALSYEIANSPLPVSRFRAVVTVTSGHRIDAGSTATWDVEYEPIGDGESARGGIQLIYDSMAGWLEQAANGDEK
jgi:polyketide cyclase/dehydrase/lipid transport protein